MFIRKKYLNNIIEELKNIIEDIYGDSGLLNDIDAINRVIRNTKADLYYLQKSVRNIEGEVYDDISSEVIAQPGGSQWLSYPTVKGRLDSIIKHLGLDVSVHTDMDAKTATRTSKLQVSKVKKVTKKTKGKK